jgi:dTDP-glucose 4,6-dehydratase
MILVTGGAGFIGANFILHWLDQKAGRVVNLDKLTYAGNLANLTTVANHPDYYFLKADICDEVAVASALQQYKPTAIMHFAAESHVDRSITGPRAFVDTNVLGTFTLLETTKKYWNGLNAADQKRFRLVHVSTDEVYGSLSPTAAPFHELTAYAPNSPYSASKAASDHFVRAYHHTYSLPTVITHCSNNYGPFQFPEKLIPRMILNALSNKSLPIYGDGLQVRDWLYVSDHCRALMAVLQQGTVGATYVIGGRNEQTNLSVVKTLCTLLDEMEPKTHGSYHDQITHITDRLGHDRRYAIDPQRIEHELNFRIQETFDSGLRKTIQWYLANPQWLTALANREEPVI